MPIIGTIHKKDIDAEYNTIKELLVKCESCKLFKGKTVDGVFIYCNYSDNMTEDGKPMLAIARYGENFAIHPPKYLTGKQWRSVLYYFLRDLEPNDRLVVFSQETFEKIKQISYGKRLNVKLCI